MADSKPVYIISDSPEKNSVSFGFDADATTIADLIANKENRTPMVIGIFGPWGSGKTTLMERVKRFLADEKYENEAVYRRCKTIWFQAWKCGKEDEILAAIIEEILRNMKNENFFNDCKKEIEQIIEGFKPMKIIDNFTKFLKGEDVTKFFSKPEHRKEFGFYDTFQDFFEQLIRAYLNCPPGGSATEKTDDTKGALVVFIDDLERCMKPEIIRVLDTIKLFMNRESYIFVISADNKIIEDALAERYGDDAGDFMDKVFQATFNLPEIPADDFASYIEQINPFIKDNILPNLPVIISAMQNNPRRLKKFLNNLAIREGIFKNRGVDLDYRYLLYWTIIEYVYPSLKKEISENPQVLSTLKDSIKNIEKRLKDKSRWELSDKILQDVPQSLHPYVLDKTLVEIVKNFDAKAENIRQLITVSEIVRGPEEKVKKNKKIHLDAMVEIPVGIFLYGRKKSEEKIEQPFLIDVFPVTNRQYEKFIKDRGYRNNDHWSDEGIKWRQKNSIFQPAYWEDEEWNQPQRPVVGVSLFESEAYARWTGKRLPTEKEWERAARGTDGREYPWGDDFDKGKCNTQESGINRTTRVTKYHNGISPGGCYDMAGNIWEWVATRRESFNALCGGSYYFEAEKARCAGRYYYIPERRNYYIGFRCARTKK